MRESGDRQNDTVAVIVEQKIAELSRFNQFLRPEGRAVFDDLLTQCKLYAAGGGRSLRVSRETDAIAILDDLRSA